MSWNDFFSSQLFGVIIGALMTGGFTWLLDCLRYKRERKAHIQQKREELYIQACHVLMEHDKYCRDHEWPKKCKEMFNELQGKMLIYASKKIYKQYYALDTEICSVYAKMKSKKQREEMSNQIADKVEAFASAMRKELGIKGVL
ncbi:MAG: hypothetical protein J6L70_03195 [Alphaproteobacteria bacterium]|nr:hypothetical protein [Alphaproteobacteria bacterium]